MQRRSLVLRQALTGSIVLITFFAIAPAPLQAAQGDCSQPVTNGAAPTASDCLFVLRTAVGSETCSPACICAPKGSLPTTATDALVCLKKAVAQPVTLDCPCQVQQGDNFDDNSKDTAKWGDDILGGGEGGVFNETNHVLQYTCPQAGLWDEAVRPWIASELPFGADWDVQLDVTDLTNSTQAFNDFGLRLFDASNALNNVEVGIYMDEASRGFWATVTTNDEECGWVDTGEIGVTNGAVRLAFDAGTKVATVFYDVDSTNGYDWVQLGSFGLAGAGGVDGNTDWGLADGDHMTIGVYGYSSMMQIKSGKIYADNFLITGGVVP